MLNEDELEESILMVIANKQDLPNAMSAAEMTDKLGLFCATASVIQAGTLGSLSPPGASATRIRLTAVVVNTRPLPLSPLNSRRAVPWRTRRLARRRWGRARLVFLRSAR